MPRVTVQIVGWNSAKTLPEAVAALKNIPPDEAVIRYIDNASSDNSVAIVREALPHADVIQLPKNEGFAKAHNIGFAKCTTPFVLVHDPDVVLDWSGMQKLLDYMATHENVGAAQGKLLRSNGLIDSAGIVLTLALNGRERGANEVDHGQFNEEQEIIAATGACALYRTTALHALTHRDAHIFDEDFFSYKEDIDVGWRMHRVGLKVMYVPIMVGTHHRTLGKRGFMNWGLNPVAIYARLRSPRTRYSLRNWVWMVAKNASWKQLLLHGCFFDLRIGTFFVLSILYPPLLMVWPQTIRGLPKMLRKR